MKFVLEIELGNEEMQTFGNISCAIRKSLRLYHDAVACGDPCAIEDTGVIHDINGNLVGKWEVKEQ